MLTLCLTLAALAGATLSGVTGVGGGTLLIGVIYAFGLAPAIAVPLHAAVQLVSNGSRTVAYLQHVDWSALRWFLLGALPSPFLIAPLMTRANPDVTRLAMAGFILLSLRPKTLGALHMNGRAGMVTAGALAGGLGAIFAASGTMIAPFFRRPEWSKQTTIATLAVCQASAHLAKVIAFASIGFGVLAYWHWLAPMIAAVLVGTWLGRNLHDHVSERAFDLVFRTILALLALKLGWDGLAGLGFFAGLSKELSAGWLDG